jgi:hypothetical protein
VYECRGSRNTCSRDPSSTTGEAHASKARLGCLTSATIKSRQKFLLANSAKGSWVALRPSNLIHVGPTNLPIRFQTQANYRNRKSPNL